MRPRLGELRCDFRAFLLARGAMLTILETVPQAQTSGISDVFEGGDGAVEHGPGQSEPTLTHDPLLSISVRFPPQCCSSTAMMLICGSSSVCSMAKRADNRAQERAAFGADDGAVLYLSFMYRPYGV